MIAGLCGLLLPTAAPAQLFDVHGIYATADSSHRTMHGIGVALTSTTAAGPLVLMEGVGFDYLRQTDLGPGQGSVSASLAAAFNRQLYLAPYVGGAVSLNRSGGNQPQWSGVRAGFDGFVGARLSSGDDPFALQLEERIVTIRGRERMHSTRLGILVAW